MSVETIVRRISIHTPEGPLAGYGTAKWEGERCREIECDAVLGGSQPESNGLYSELEECLEGEGAQPVDHAVRCATSGGTYTVYLLDD
jgi:hypothetical protein